MEGIEIIRYNPVLQKAFKYIVENSKSNYLPYHNLNHLLTVLKYADYIAQGEEVYYDQRLPLHLAALFHDVDHSGGKLNDSENILLAKTAFCKFASQESLGVTTIFQVERLIDCTEFPYKIPNSNIDKLQMILRDADLMQAFEYNWISQITLGLAAEQNMTIQEFIPKQRHFIESIAYLTKTGKKFKNKNWSKTMNEFRILEVSMGL